MSASACAKKVTVTELPEIAPVASLGQIANNGTNRARKFKMEGSSEQQQINERELASAKKVEVSELREIAQVAS